MSDKERLEEIKEEVELLRDDMCVTSIEVDTSADAILDDMEWLINRVQELEEDNKNLQVLSSINRKEHMRIHEQNKRYREAIEYVINAKVNQYASVENIINDIKFVISEALESESDE